MRLHLRLMLAASGLVGLPSAFAAETPIDIKTDLKGRYFIVEKTGTPNNPTLVVKRVWPGGTYYIKRLFDCQAQTVQYQGEGETLKEMAKALPDSKPSLIQEGTIADQLARHVCPK